ncbi:hypothetical protein TREMEDRAFT_23568, partial [Tremella mesenterica DSM 1558]|uniref:uncharacterized protein n=1 Tax=Tremella mesenterica (strain ATCC 24925 / CBS 8224 / DSM 1558 / NBRC 9311 / NRRL Y-6157 / RJB 2259-6 / UBC 559-6) TaxID=578456 RepID=UPI0003F49F4A
LNLPREIFLRREWTILALVLPGPKEPVALALNNLLKPLVDDLKILERGILANVYGHDQLQPVLMQMMFSSSDMPATRKIAGSYGHAAKYCCNHCRIKTSDLKTATAYDWKHLPLHEPAELLKAAIKHRDSSPEERIRLEKKHGVRWSELVTLVGFEHSAFCPPDAMHNVALG